MSARRIDGMDMMLEAFRSNRSLKFNPNSDQEIVCSGSYWDGFDVTGKKLTLKVISVNDKLYFLFETPETQILCPSIGIVEEHHKLNAKKRLLCGFLQSQDGVYHTIEYDIPHEKYGKEQKIDAFFTSMQIGETSQCKIKCTTGAFHTDKYYLYTPEYWPKAPQTELRKPFKGQRRSVNAFSENRNAFPSLYG